MDGNTLDSAAHLAAIILSSDDAIVSKDLNGVIQSWNRAAEHMFGYSSDEALGRHISLIIPPDRLFEEDFVIGRIRAGRGVDHYETIRQRKDGSLIEVSLTVSPIHGRDGRVVGASKIARDISETKRLLRVAEEASRAKDQFLATLSHELRTPLNTVLGYVQMLQNGSLPADQHAKALDVIARNATALGRLVDDVLDTSRIITGKMRVELKPCILSTIVDQAIASIRPAAQSRGLVLKTDVEPGLAVLADPDRLGQVLWNLLSNAVKFTDHGGSISVVARRNGQQISIVVTDTGIGIAPDQIPYVFQRFWQGGPETGTAKGGLGLGLALSRHFVELHGGMITAQSEGHNKGTRFEITLPVPPMAVSATS